MSGISSIAKLLSIDVSRYTPERDAEIAEYERSREVAERTKRYMEQVPERYWSESLGSYRTDTAERKSSLEKARAFVQCVRGGGFQTLLLLGNAGTGKTHLACGIIRECGGLYRLAPAMCEEIRRAKSFGARETEADILDRYGRASLLVIDETGRGIAAAEEQYMLYQVINERYNRRKPTVLISNQTKKDFLCYVGAAATDRLAESAQAVEFSGKSYRLEIRLGKEELR